MFDDVDDDGVGSVSDSADTDGVGSDSDPEDGDEVAGHWFNGLHSKYASSGISSGLNG